MDYAQARKKWESQFPSYQNFSRLIALEIESALKGQGLMSCVHQITNRTKSPERFEEKCGRKRYRDPFREMKDLSAVRVITLFEADTVLVSEAICDHFVIDLEHSHIRAPKSARQLSYRTIHLVAGLSDETASKTEFSGFAEVQVEIQIRSVLQHAWAEIDHDSRYKSDFELPPELERRLYLIAGLLEVADREFNDFRDKRNNLIEEAKKEIAEQQVSSEPLTHVFIEASLELVATKLGFTDSYIKENAGKILSLSNDYCIRTVGDYIPLLNDLEKIFEFSKVLKSYLVNQVKGYNRPMTSGFVIFSGILLQKGLRPWSDGMPIDWVKAASGALKDFKLRNEGI